MLPDKFFEEYMKTGTPREPAPTDEEPTKDSYTPAEVDAIVTKKVAEAVDHIKSAFAAADAPAAAEEEIPEASQE